MSDEPRDDHSAHRDEGRLLDILLSARRIVQSTSGISRGAFDTRDEKRDSVVLHLGYIGEAARRMSDSFQKVHASIPWSELRRHKLFVLEEDVDWDVVWKTATEIVPGLIEKIEPLLPPEESLE